MTDSDEPDPTWRCDPTLEEVYRFISGRVSETEQSEFHHHLEDCPGCDDILHFHRSLRTMMGSCREDMPPDVRQRLLDSITKLF